MTRNSSFLRKVIYLCLIALLLIPISWISRPSTRENSGGKLAQLRTEHGLSQAELGEIDPASATMQLATLGLRGPAATLLWTRAIEFKKKERWDRFAATLNQIAKIQPHMINVWKHQAWNVAYNVSVEFDDHRIRYQWVKKGVDFMLKGTRYNADSPKLLNELGWFFSHKFGRSDEHRQYRYLFKHDKEFHETLPFYTRDWDRVRQHSPDDLPDSWLVSWLWHLRAEQAADDDPRKELGASRLVFFSRAPMALMYFAPAIEEDGFLDEKARQAWIHAGQQWHKYGDRNVITSYGVQISLNKLELLEQQIISLREELEQLTPGVRDNLIADRKDSLSEAEREAYETPWPERDEQQYELAVRAERQMEITHRDIAQGAPEEVRARAIKVAARLVRLESEALYTKRYRGQINFEYWRTRSEIEQTQTVIEARRNVYEADSYALEAKLLPAREAYEKAWNLWAEIFHEHPEMLHDTTAEDLMEEVDRYRKLLRQLDVAFPPPDFPLMNLVRVQDRNFAEPQPSVAPREEAEGGQEEAESPSGEGNAASDEPEAVGDEEPAAEEL